MSKTLWSELKRTIRKAIERMIDYKNIIPESELLHPGDEIPDNKFIYLINNSNSNKKLVVNGIKTVLTAPGSEGSVQAVNTEVLTNPVVVALWARDEILVTASQKVQQQAIANITAKQQKEQAKLESLKSKVVEKKAGTNLAEGKDVSYKARSLSNADMRIEKPAISVTSNSELI